MKKFFLVLFILLSNLTFAQRKLTYPIILIHGWTAGSETWDEFTNYLKNSQQLSVCPLPLRFNLNADGNAATANLTNDVAHNNFSGIGNYDVYVIDFDYDKNNLSQSNQAAIVKQGYALSIAVREVLNQTQAQRVMLLGHSMGGLVAREYLQNQIYDNATSDVAKIVTIGTPHNGSNYGDVDINALKQFGKDIRSEAVRDLRTSYKNGKSGVYLWGGYESSSYMQIGLTGIAEYYNLDVNCNGRTGDQITGLNQRPLVGTTDYACIVGGTISDGVVTAESQNLKTLYKTANIDVFNYNCNNSSSLICHTSEPKQAFFEMIQGLDESKSVLAPLYIGKEMSGFFSKQANGDVIDIDEFNTFLANKGFLNVAASFANGVGMMMRLRNVSGTFDKTINLNNNNYTSIEIPSGGTYTVSFIGNSLGGATKYNVSTSMSTIVIPTCDFPTPQLYASNYELCEGITGNLLVRDDTYDSYSWRKDGKEVKLTSTDNFSITEAGIYSVEVGKCGTKKVSNVLNIIGKPNPKPLLTLDIRSDKYVLTSTGKTNAWKVNGIYTGRQTLGDTYQTDAEGTYQAWAYYDNGCVNGSNIITIKTEKPSIKISNDKPLFCMGDTVKLETDKLFSKYRWIMDKDTITTTTNTLSVSKISMVSVIAYRGSTKSPKSDDIAVRLNALPQTPIISVADNLLISSATAGNQWYNNGQILNNETAQVLSKYQSGSYFVKVTENGCSSRSVSLTITANEPTNLMALKVFPNPSNGNFNLQLPSQDAYKMQISDLQGRIIETKEGNNEAQVQLNLSNWNTGIYFVNLVTKNRVFNSKLIIQ